MKKCYWEKLYLESSKQNLNPKPKDFLTGVIISSIFFQSDERQQEIEKNVTDQEQRYLKYMCKSY